MHNEDMTNTTHATAIKQATAVTVPELAAMLTADNNPRIYPAKGKRAVIAMNAYHADHAETGRGHVFYERCKFGTGTMGTGIVSLGWAFEQPVFEFEAADGTLTFVYVAPIG